MAVCLYRDYHDCYVASGIVYSKEPGARFFCLKQGENLDINEIGISEDEKVIIINKYFETQDFRKLIDTTKNIVWFCNYPAILNHFNEHFPGRKLDGGQNVNKSCSLLCWEYYYPGIKVPDVVELIQKDFCGKRETDPNIDNLIFGLEVSDYSPGSSTWKVLFFGKGEGPYNLFKEIIKKGGVIVDFLQKQKEKNR